MHNEIKEQNIDENDFCDQFIVRNQTIASKHYHNYHKRKDNRPFDSLDHQLFSDKPQFGILNKDSDESEIELSVPGLSCNENNKNESNIIILSSSISSCSSMSDHEPKANHPTSGYYQSDQVISPNSKTIQMRNLLNKKIF